MSNLLRRSIWFGRLVLGAAALLLTKLGLGDILGPVAVAGRTHTTLGSPDAITVVRVQGGVFIGIAVLLAYCLASDRRLLVGLVLATIITGVAALRLIGLMLGGPGPFALMVLKPEVALSVLSACAALLERRRSQSLALNP
jgi:Domain of unknown function (DUF4345)